MAIDDPRDPQLDAALATLRDSIPANDLWPGIERQLVPRRPRGTLLLRWPAALAAGIAIAVLASGGTLAWLRQQHSGESLAGHNVAATPKSTTALVSATFAPGDAAVARAITDLEGVVRERLATADPSTRAAVDTSLATLDRAIAQAATRQTAAPDDPRAARYLTSTLLKKLQVLRTVSRLMSES